ncbi:MAG: phosphatase PAP2 family protein [Planctomycetia bacterium]|nr:phosphatase PAP2 family protein [Planctomycetia bacterium]
MIAPTHPRADPPPPARGAPWPRRALLAAAGLLALVGVAALAIDMPVAAFCQAGRVPKELLRFLNFSEVCAHSLGVATLLVTALVLDRGLAFPVLSWPAVVRPSLQPGAARQRMARMIAAVACGGLAVDVVKLCVSRARPRAIDVASQASALATFGLIPASGSRSDSHSFPSGHAAVACGLMAALAWRYPHGRWLFALLAASAAAQRVATSAHYPSDVCFGAALGLAGAALVLGDTSGTSPAATVPEP